MKKLALYILAVVAGIAAVSCVREEKATYDITQAIPPVINNFVTDEDGNVFVTFTPGTLGMSFNEKMPVNHSLVLLKADGKEASRVLTSSVEGNVISTTVKSLSRGLATLGYVDGDVVKEVELSLRASLQEQSKDNGLNGYVESVERVTLQNVLVVLPQDSPYKEYEKLSDWTIIGSIAAYEMSWDKDLSMWTDGNHNYVAAHVNLAKGDEFKFRKDLDWTVNFGGDFAGLDAEFDIAQDGNNIKVDADGVFDIYFNDETKKAWISEAFDPYPDFTEISAWSVIGSLKLYNISWDGDIAMMTDGNGNHLALNVSLDKADEFKFRKDADWTENYGGDFGGLGNDFAVTQDGNNIKVEAEGNFDLLLNTEAKTANVSEACGARVSYIILPEEEPVPEEKGWGIVGDFNGWGDDVLMTEDNGIWTAYFTNANKEDGSNGAFKFRKNLAWDENYGAPGDAEPVAIKLGEAMELAAGGKNLSAPAGMYHVTLDLTNAEAPTATFVSADVFSLIGNINGTSWDTDFELAEEAGVYTSELVYIDGGFKIRHNFSWADEDTYGAEADDFTPEMGAAFTAAQPGKDIKLPAGNYKVQFTPATKEVIITRVDYELPDIDLTQFEYLEAMAGAETWGLIGPAQPGGWDTDTDLQKVQDDPEVWAVMNIALQANKFKFRGNDTWGDYDLGGGASFEMDTPIVMTKGGGDMSAELGVYTIFLYPTYGLLYITEGSGDVPPPPAKPTMWSLVGTIGGTSWDADLDMTNVSGDIWEVRNVAVTASDEFKIRADHSWDTNVGGPEENSTSTIDPANPYGVYKPVLGEAFAAGDKNIQIGVEGNYNVTFDYAQQTILIEEYKEYPEQLFMIGEEFGNWSWESDGVVEMTPVLHNPEWGANAEGQFYTVRYFSANKGFKFCSKRAWSGDFWGLETNDGFVESGGNCTVTADGFYLVHIDFKAGKVHVEPAKVYGIGDAFGSWDEAVADNLFVADGTTLKATVKAAGNLRMYVASEIATSAWWTREFNIIDGKIVYRLMDELSAPAVLKDQVAVLDFNAGTGEIQGEGEQPSADYADYIYAIGGDTGWSGVYPLRSAQTSGVNNGKYKGFGYLSQEFKFKPNEGDWTGDWECVGDGQIGQGSDNCPAPATAGYYMIEVDLTAMTYSLTLINSIGIIGPAQTGGWDSDTDMTYNATNGAWEAKNVALSAGEMKFRANDGWDINWGGALDALNQGGANIAVEAGTYDIALFAWCDGKAYATLTPAGGAQISITIDGDMSDWADVVGTVQDVDPSSSAYITELKGFADDDNIYVYVKRAKQGRWGELWGGDSSHQGYYYYDFDLDNNPETGDQTENSHGKYEAYCYVYLFGGTKDAPVFRETPEGSFKGMTGTNLKFKGVVTENDIEVEASFPRADLPAISGDTIAVTVWGNKDGNPLTKVTFNVK